VTSAFGSHNVRSIAHAMARADQLGVNRSRFEFQLLYGMGAPIKRALVEMGYRVREYCPVGELLPGMSYLVRRLLENTSNEGFLRAKFAENVSEEELLRDPREVLSQNGETRSVASQEIGGRLYQTPGDAVSQRQPAKDQASEIQSTTMTTTQDRHREVFEN